MTRQTHTHETLGRPETVKVGSERGFGMVFAAVFIIVAAWPLVGGGEVRVWALGAAAAFLLAALAFPAVLRPLNLAWFRFGLVLHKIVSPVFLGLIFYLSVTPIALIMRLLGKDPLRRDFDPSMSTYWIERKPPGPAPDSLKNQF